MTQFKAQRIAVVGASSQIGQILLSRLAFSGYLSYRIGREDRSSSEDTRTHVFQESYGIFVPNLETADVVISLAPLPSIEIVIKMAMALGAKRIIAFGSTGRFSKVGSTSLIEHDFVVQQERAEFLLIKQCEELGIRWTLFRPTMIYGADADQNVTFIRLMIRKFGFFPIPIGANGLRQPVHVEDLADACISALVFEATTNKTYNLGGGGVLSIRDMIKKIFEAEGRIAILLPLPKLLFSLLLSLLKWLPFATFVRKEMIDRMFQDLIVDNTNAMNDFGYSPRAFILKSRELKK